MRIRWWLGALSALPAAVALLTGVPAAVTATVRPCLLNNTSVAELRLWSFQALCHVDLKFLDKKTFTRELAFDIQLSREQ